MSALVYPNDTNVFVLLVSHASCLDYEQLFIKCSKLQSSYRGAQFYRMRYRGEVLSQK